MWKSWHYCHHWSHPSSNFILPTFIHCPFSWKVLFCLVSLHVFFVLQIPVGGQKPLSALWWSVLAALVSRCSAPPALCATCPGKSWWCHGSTQIGRIRRVWASSCSAMLNPTLRRLRLKGDCLCSAVRELVTWYLHQVHHHITSQSFTKFVSPLFYPILCS